MERERKTKTEKLMERERRRVKWIERGRKTKREMAGKRKKAKER